MGTSVGISCANTSRCSIRGSRLKFVATAGHAGKPLNVALADWLPGQLGRPVSKAKVRKLIMAGAVYLNGARIRNPSIRLASGMTVEAHVDPAKLFEDLTSRDRKFELTPDRILFEDAATGARSPALVRQGQIGELVNAKPEQRRRILEDAAGIAGLHSRRHEAELRLRAAEGNLARLRDILDQLNGQIEGL